MESEKNKHDCPPILKPNMARHACAQAPYSNFPASTVDVVFLGARGATNISGATAGLVSKRLEETARKRTSVSSKIDAGPGTAAAVDTAECLCLPYSPRPRLGSRSFGDLWVPSDLCRTMVGSPRLKNSFGMLASFGYSCCSRSCRCQQHYESFSRM